MEGCSNSVVAAFIALFLVLPVQYYIPGLSYIDEPLSKNNLDVQSDVIDEPKPTSKWVSLQINLLDVFVTFVLLLATLCIYISDWIQRKLTERRIRKLNQSLTSCLERLRAWDARQTQLDATLKMVQNATTEYNMLLYLLLHQRQFSADPKKTSNVHFSKDLDINFPPYITRFATNMYEQDNL